MEQYAGPSISGQVRVVTGWAVNVPRGYVDPALEAGSTVDVLAFSTENPNELTIYGAETTHIIVVDQAPEPSPPTPPQDNATLQVDPQAGPPGTVHEVIIQGFQPDEALELQIIYEPTGERVYRARAAAGSSGSGRFSFYFESTDLPGDYRITVTGSSGASASVTVTLEP